MRVLITTDTVGGVWTFSRELTTGLLDEGCSVCLVSVGRVASEAQSPWIAKMQSRYPARFRFDAVNAPLEWEACNADAFSAAAPALLHLAKDFQADIIHSNQFCFGALKTSRPVIVTAHSDVLSWADACRPLEDTSWLRAYKTLVGRGLTHASAVTAPSQWMLDLLCKRVAPECFAAAAVNGRKAHSSSMNECRVIPNGREIGAHVKGVRRLQAVTAGRVWDEAKNVALLAEVEAPMPLMIAGEKTHDGFAQSYLPGQETYLGSLCEQEIMRTFRESAIYICTSVYEPFGLAPLEAALCGCAILARDLPSLREIWGDAALYFRDAASLSDLLKKLAVYPNVLALRQEAALSRARLYTRKAMSSAYLDLYEELAQAQVRSPESLRVA